VPAALVDTNVWIAAVFPTHPAHRLAQRHLESATAAEPAFFCRATQQSFLRLVSTPALLKVYGVDRAGNRDAIAALQAFASLPQVRVAEEPPGLFSLWLQLGTTERPAPKLWMDAYLAAFAISAALPLLTLDRDFEAFTSAGLCLERLDAATEEC
jgi:toxin-antitoxin system PIN domain toxin